MQWCWCIPQFCVTRLLLMNNEILQSILRIYTVQQTSCAHAKFTYSCVVFSLSYVKVQNAWLYYMQFVCGLMAISCRLPPQSSLSSATTVLIVVCWHPLPPPSSSAAAVARHRLLSSSSAVAVHRHPLPTLSVIRHVHVYVNFHEI